MHALMKTGLRFASVGIVNTILGYGIILACLAAGLPDIISNALGYIAGLTITFFANRRWTFAQNNHVNLPEIGRFLSVFLICWLVNISIILLGLTLGYAGNPILHFIGLVTYSSLFFLLSGRFVYRGTISFAGWRGLLPECAVIITGLFFAIIFAKLPLTHDVVWQLWIARQMNNGVGLYSQIMELNPPLWFWMAQPIDSLSRWSGIAASSLLVSAFASMAVLSALLVGAAGRFRSEYERTLAMLLTIFTVMLVSVYDFAQREQITLAAALPYVVLLSRRYAGHKTAWPLALGIAIFAAIGFALKHYFVLVPLCLEIMLFLHFRRKYNPFRPETFALAAMALLYIVAILIFTPEFLTIIYPMVDTAYFGYETSVYRWFDEPIQLLWAFAIIAIFLAMKEKGKALTVFEKTFSVAAFAFFLSYLVQQKGWQYHAIPTSGMLIFLLAANIFGKQGSLCALMQPILRPMVLLLFFILSISQGTYANIYQKQYGKFFEETQNGSAIMFVTSDPQWIWPAVEQTDTVWSSRYFAHWMLPAIGYYRKNNIRNVKVEQLEHDVLAATYEDIMCNPPAFIAIEKSMPNFTMRPKGFNTLEFIKEHKPLKAYMMANYKSHTQNKWLHMFRRTTPIEATQSQDCRPIF
jgi:putative flippase GtrA